MPFYYEINSRTQAGKRTAASLLALKDSFDEVGLPQGTVNDTVMLATWNIREFDSEKYGIRTLEPILYIAEIVSRFDLVAIQEVREDLRALNLLMRYLGGWWKVLVTDVTEGRRGNRERMAFLYDSRKISFGGLAGEIVVPPVTKKGVKLEPAEQLARTPFLVGFRAGWFRFTICTTHILYGTEEAEDPERIAEIEALASFLAARAKEKSAWARNMILLGDFNIFDTTDATMAAMTKPGFVVPKPLQTLPSNAPRTKHYDQIAFIAPDVQDQFELARAGVYNFFDVIYGEGDGETYKDAMGEGYLVTKTGEERDERGRTRYYKDWRTYQMSDHLPMWIELKIDFGREYLKRKLEQPAAPDAPPPAPPAENPR